jgi:phosphate-selective porin OprO/OprP
VTGHRWMALPLVLLALGASAGVASAQEAAASPAPPNKPEESQPEPDVPATVSWRDGHLTFDSDRGSLTLSNRIQFRYTYEKPDDDTTLSGTREPGTSRGSFRIRRAKTQLEGWIWRRELTYEMQIGWAAADSGPASGTFSGLEDAFANYDLTGDGRLQLRGGQFKVPFGRQEMTSSEKLQFVDRDILSFEFTRSRDVGLMIWGQTDQARVQYWAGLFNGNQRNRAANDNDKYQFDARVTFQPWGDVGFSEGDFESRDRLLLAVSGQVEQNDQSGATNATDLKTTAFGGDVVVKYKGASLFAELFARDRDPEEGGPRSAFEPQGPPPPAYSSNGWHAQVGYFVKRDVVELAARYATWDPSDNVAGNDRTEIGGVVNYFVNKHRLKIQADLRQVEDEAADTKDTEFRTQLQLVF